MPETTTLGWRRLERQSTTLFLVAAALFLVDAGLLVLDLAVGTERLSLMVGQAFIAAGWIAGLLGLLGQYPVLVDENRWLARAAAVFAAVGVVGFTVMGAASLWLFATGAALDDLTAYVPFFLPGVIAGSLLAFVAFAAASLRSDAHSRPLGVLLLVPSAVFVTNLLSGENTTLVTLAIVSALVVSMLAIGYVLRAHVPAGREEVEAASEPTP